ncbi:hypothetical protein M2428_004227 [Arthrobacter sp. ES3-54]|nr:hypothetical protein [Arthrobacter sp. ES3-54]
MAAKHPHAKSPYRGHYSTLTLTRCTTLLPMPW